jgi:hypothetical protein
MEQGLGITFQQILQLRTDLNGLLPQQAEKLQSLSTQLYTGTCPDLCATAIERQELLKDIRRQGGLEYFLLPKPYKALSYAAQGGPIVLLSSHHEHCDGIIIPNPTSNPVHVSLPNVTMEELESKQKVLKALLGHCNVRTREESTSTRLFGRRELFGLESFTNLLDWLFQNVVAPVYQALGLASNFPLFSIQIMLTLYIA